MKIIYELQWDFGEGYVSLMLHENKPELEKFCDSIRDYDNKFIPLIVEQDWEGLECFDENHPLSEYSGDILCVSCEDYLSDFLKTDGISLAENLDIVERKLFTGILYND